MVRIPAMIAMASLAACSVGSGSGWARGSLRDRACGVDIPDYSLAPTFFAGDFIEDITDPDGMIRRRLTIRIQRGSYREGASDGIYIYVRDVNEIERAAIGVPIEIRASSDAPVQMIAYFNQTCPFGIPDEYWQIPSVMEAFSGTITFDEIYAPDVDPESTMTRAHFENVELRVPGRTDRTATLSGEFAFSYQRGRPAQPFP